VSDKILNGTSAQLDYTEQLVNYWGVNSSKTTWARDFKFGMQLCMGIGNAEKAQWA